MDSVIRCIPAFVLSLAVLASAAPLPRPSPDFAVHLATSGEVSPAQYHGKVVVLAFILTTCSHCQHSTQMLSGLQREYGPRGLQVPAPAFNEIAPMLVPDFINQIVPAFPAGNNNRRQDAAHLDHSCPMTHVS